MIVMTPRQWLMTGAGFLLLLSLPIFLPNFWLANILGRAMVYGIVALSLTFLAHYGGFVSLAQTMMAGVAGYAVAMMAPTAIPLGPMAMPYGFAIPLAVLAATFAGALVGLIAVNTREIYLLMITLALAVGFSLFAQSNTQWFRGYEGIRNIVGPELFGMPFRTHIVFYYVALIMAVLMYLLVLYVVRTPFGLALQAIRDAGDDRIGRTRRGPFLLAHAAVPGMLARGGSVSIIDSFSTSEFWPAIRETESTVVLLLGAMATFVVKQPPGPDDRNHPLRTVIIVPLAEDARAFAERFGVTVYTLYNMSEISTPLVSEANPARTGICGRPRDGVTLRLVDANDCEVGPGEVGELIVRTDAPWALNSGYFKNPVATAESLRNGWFHTGDAFFVNEDGDYVFFDRMKDAIRRRGENVSSFEVEAEVASHPAVNEAAVVAVPSEHTEDEILCIVAPVPGKTVDPAELVAYLQPRMAHFMIPRYIRVIDVLPRTPTAKIRKNLLRDDGITEDTWDREAAGIVIRRERIG